MSSTKVKTTYEEMGSHGSSKVRTLYCNHHSGSDTFTYYDEDGDVMGMAFQEWSRGKDLWDAMKRLYYPFKEKWHGELLDGVEYYINIGD
jgi:hypothetical protein